MRERGFTLLEMLVATAIMAVAVVGLLSSISTSLNNASRLTDYDRAALAAKRKMDELLLDPALQRQVPVEGVFDPASSGGFKGGWTAQLTPYEMPPIPGGRPLILDRLELEVWWKNGGRRRTLKLEAFRNAYLEPVPQAEGAQP
jgi:general secretion pathway protein I